MRRDKVELAKLVAKELTELGLWPSERLSRHLDIVAIDLVDFMRAGKELEK